MASQDFFPFVTSQEFNNLRMEVNTIAVRLGQEIAQINGAITSIGNTIEEMPFAESEEF